MCLVTLGLLAGKLLSQAKPAALPFHLPVFSTLGGLVIVRCLTQLTYTKITYTQLAKGYRVETVIVQFISCCFGREV